MKVDMLWERFRCKEEGGQYAIILKSSTEESWATLHKKWKHYLMGKKTIIHTDHQPLQYLQAQSKLQKTRQKIPFTKSDKFYQIS